MIRRIGSVVKIQKVTEEDVDKYIKEVEANLPGDFEDFGDDKKEDKKDTKKKSKKKTK